MAKFDLTPMQSQYVDPGYAKVAEVLRNRYDQTLEKKSLLDRAYAQIQVGKGDEWLINNAKAEGENILRNYSQNGNWESGAASLAIDDATNSLLSNRGVQLAQQSYNTRQAELEFINEQRLKGNNIWDFGSNSFDEHQSYIQNENGTWVENPYTVQNEIELDYNGEMASLVQNFGQDTYATDEYIDDVYKTYVQSQIGDQDYRRLVFIELQQAFPDASPIELAIMAEANIKERLRSFTRQAEYENAVGKDNSDLNGNNTRTQTAVEVTEPLDVYDSKSKNSFVSSAEHLRTNHTRTNLSEEERAVILEELETQRHDTYAEVAKKTNNTQAYTEYNKLRQAFESQAEIDGSNRYLELFETINMLTANTNSSFHTTSMGEITEDAISTGAATATAGATLGLMGGPFAEVTVPFAAAAGYISGSAGQIIWNVWEEITDQVVGLNNVRDWERPQEEGFVSFFIDTESDQLMDEMEKLDELNKIMPNANWTKEDIPKMQELAKAMYIYKTEKGGDALDEGWNANGPYMTRKGVRFDASPEGAKFRTAFNKAIAASDPESDFQMVLKEGSDREDINNNWGSAEVSAAYVGDPLRNLPNSIKIKYEKQDAVGDGTETRHTILRSKPTNDGTASGWAKDIAENMQDYSFVENELIINRLQDLKSRGNTLDIRTYFNTRQQVLANRLGTDGASEQIDRELDMMLIEEIYGDPSLVSGKVLGSGDNEVFIGGSSMLRANENAIEFYDMSKDQFTPLDMNTLPVFKNQYRQETLAIANSILNDTKINEYYK